MEPVSRSAGRTQVILALCMACAGGCGTSYEMPKEKPLEHAAPDIFTVRSLTVNGREMSDGNAGEVAADGPLEVKGEIDFREGRPQPPIVHVHFVNESGDRPVTAGGAVGRLAARTARGTPFTVSVKAPVRPGTYTLRLTAKPPSSARKKSEAGSGRPMIYAEGKLTVVAGE
jgi:hypothetical protein